MADSAVKKAQTKQTQHDDSKTGQGASAKTQSESLAFSAEISKVLRLMIHSLYTNKDIFLRELISNASDACDKLRFRALTTPALMEGGEELRLTIGHDEEARTITVTDTGIGMNRDDLIAQLGTIARSGTEEFASQLSGDAARDSALIGQFGVGFYASFMVADRVEVRTRRAGEAEGWLWVSDGGGSYTITPEDGLARGTSITLHLREDAAEYLDTFRLRHIIETYSDHISFPIYQRPVTHAGVGEPELVNEGGALWRRPKAEISEEQYREFYRHVAHSPDTPWAVMHQVAEGRVSYTALLFIPSMKPFDLFHPERRRRVKLYVRRVFITEENAELVPHWLRFLRGVIDSDDLPLNISRETLQDDPRLRLIRESVTGKVLSELKKRAEGEPEAYATFWEHFGAVVKEGLCEATAPKEKLLEVCRFTSTQGEMVSLKDYIARRKDGQEHVYYLTADSAEAAARSPLLGGFKERGVEVLLLSDHVDDFWVNVVGSYEGVAFKSVTRSDIDLDAFAPQEGDATKQGGEASESPSGLNEAARDALLLRLKACYGDEIKDVRATTKLSDALACLAVDEGAMDLRMERFLMEHHQLPKRAAKVLEVNIRHPLMTHLAALAGEDARRGEFEDYARLILDQACIIEGESVADPAGFAVRLSALMQRAVGG